jgi:hypothetical protein
MHTSKPLPIHFFTIVLNGEPFIRYHLDRMRALEVPWHWHIVEGMAELRHDTSWAVNFGGTLPLELVQDSRSVDGTAEYLDQIASENPNRITIYRQENGRKWDGKREMIAAPLINIQEECLLWEIDADELWTTAQFQQLHQLFTEQPERNAAIFYCHYFVGPDLVIDRSRQCPEIEWRRAWRYKPGMRWLAHEPPVLAASHGDNRWYDISTHKPFWPCELESYGLVFQHFAYATQAQLEFKEKYYGYKNIFREWQRLQAHAKLPVRLREFFDWPWVHPDAFVEAPTKIEPLAKKSGDQWVFSNPPQARVLPPKRGVLYLKWGVKNDEQHQRSMTSVKAFHPDIPIHTHLLPDESTLLDKSVMFRASPFEETLYLDTDTVVLGRLDFGFQMATRHDLACCICENPWARRNGGLSGDLVEYNTGVLFFTRDAKDIFESWIEHSRSVDSSIPFLLQGKLETMPYNDQASFSLAVAARAKQPFVLPLNWNFRPSWHRAWWGPVKVWHDYRPVPNEIAQWSQSQAEPTSIIQFAQMG